MDYTNRVLRERHRSIPLPTYRPEAFERMLDEQQVDRVIVTSIDRTHHHYIIRSLEAGRDVISEKPMTIDADKCRAVLEAVGRTGREAARRPSTTATPPATAP